MGTAIGVVSLQHRAPVATPVTYLSDVYYMHQLCYKYTVVIHLQQFQRGAEVFPIPGCHRCKPLVSIQTMGNAELSAVEPTLKYRKENTAKRYFAENFVQATAGSAGRVEMQSIIQMKCRQNVHSTSSNPEPIRTVDGAVEHMDGNKRRMTLTRSNWQFHLNFRSRCKSF